MTMILRKEQVLKKTGYKTHASIYNLIRAGLWTKPVRIGIRSSGWPLTEVDTMVDAMAAGLPEEKRRELVDRLHAERNEKKQPSPMAPVVSPTSRRDLFAAAALQGLLANPQLKAEIMKSGGCAGGWIETSAWGFADEMLKAESK